MAVFIQSTSNISPQKTFGNVGFLAEAVDYTGNRLACIEPDYKELINPKLIRRMSRIIKMGVSAGLACLQNAGVTSPGAIVTGTAYGCLEDTGVFLTNMVEQNEEPLTPTAFVHSTHNTIGAQIALLLQCNAYNNTFVSGGASFESALLDAMMLVDEGADHVLAGAIDETTDISHTILTRFGLYKRIPVNSLQLYSAGTAGTIAGEGAAFFLLSGQPHPNNLAKIDAITTFYKPTTTNETEQHIQAFLTAQNIAPADISLLLTGHNGDAKNDAVYTQVQQTVLGGIPAAQYKHLCGEYPTSTAFALWLAANIVHTNSLPTALQYHGQRAGNLNKVLVYNHYQHTYHSLMLVSAC